MLASDRFRAALPYSHRVYEYADVVTAGGDTIRLKVTQGSVTVDRTSQFRRTAQINCFDPTGAITPQSEQSELTPFGSRLIPYQGILYQDGTSEVYPLGEFYIANSTVTQADPKGGQGLTIQLTAYDKSRKISRDKFWSAYVVQKGTLVTAAIQSLVYRTFPDATFDLFTHGMTLPYPLTYATGDDPWQAVTDLATSIGCVAYFDSFGTCVVAPPADVSALANPVWTYIEGPGCTMTDVNVVYDDASLYNGFTVIGSTPSGAGAPVQATVWDNDPESPTYQYGPYGRVSRVLNDSNITTVADAQAAAAALLNAQIGLTTQTNVQTWACNTALDIDDVVQVERASVNASGLYIVDAFTVPMGASVTGTPASQVYGSVTLRRNTIFRAGHHDFRHL